MQRPSQTLACTQLESREVPTVTAGFSSGTLTLRGNGAADHIRIHETAGRVTVDGFTGSVAVSQVRSVVIDGGAGNDVVVLDVGRSLAAKVTARGGTGTDAVVGDYGARFVQVAGFEQGFNSAARAGDRGWVDSSFRNIKGEFEVTGGATNQYNCIAWSLGVTSRWINPPATLGACDRLNAQYGYYRTSGLDFSQRAGFEKVVLYGKKNAAGQVTEFTHQARQLRDGSWTSKLGSGVQIRHVSPNGLDGGTYGVPVAVYHRFNQNFY